LARPWYLFGKFTYRPSISAIYPFQRDKKHLSSSLTLTKDRRFIFQMEEESAMSSLIHGWIAERREYQEKIVKTSIRENILIILPTGLGKTVIAAMVAVERLRAFPDDARAPTSWQNRAKRVRAHRDSNGRKPKGRSLLLYSKV
jgi:hypothetical protein